MDNQPRSVVGLDSFNVAESVIRSLRSKNTALRRELQFGFQPPAQIHSKDLNEMIEKGTHQKIQEDQKLKQINEAIERYEPAALSKSTTSLSSTVSYSKNRGPPLKQANNDSDDDFDSDEEDRQMSGSKSAKGRKADSLRNAIRNSKKYDNFGDECDFNATETNKQIHKPKTSYDDIDDDFDHDDDDDEDMKEIFKDFVAPTNKLRTSTQSLSSTSNSTSKKNANNTDILNTTGKMGITIKPGQAIRVKPTAGKKKP